jgi:hypothetical protein
MSSSTQFLSRNVRLGSLESIGGGAPLAIEHDGAARSGPRHRRPVDRLQCHRLPGGPVHPAALTAQPAPLLCITVRNQILQVRACRRDPMNRGKMGSALLPMKLKTHVGGQRTGG